MRQRSVADVQPLKIDDVRGTPARQDAGDLVRCVVLEERHGFLARTGGARGNKGIGATPQDVILGAEARGRWRRGPIAFASSAHTKSSVRNRDPRETLTSNAAGGAKGRRPRRPRPRSLWAAPSRVARSTSGSSRTRSVDTTRGRLPGLAEPAVGRSGSWIGTACVLGSRRVGLSRRRAPADRLPRVPPRAAPLRGRRAPRWWRWG